MIGEVVDVSKPCTAPERIVLHGTYIDLVPLQPSHITELWPLLEGPDNASIWDHWPVGPYKDVESYKEDMKNFYDKTDPLFWSIIDHKIGKCQGFAVLGEINMENRHIEAGMFLSLVLQKTTAATEAFYLIADLAFDLNFRRLAWKTNKANMASRRAAERYGMQFEGVWRQHQINKGMNRDSAWYSIIDKEWPVRKAAFQQWLQADNFDREGKQKNSLAAIRYRLEADAEL